MQIADLGAFILPVHCVTDCNDLLELATGERGIPADKSQRLSVLSIREERLSGRCRLFSHVPTDVMLADALTKLGTFPVFLKFQSTGIWDTTLPTSTKKLLKITTRTLARRNDFDENDFENLKE